MTPKLFTSYFGNLKNIPEDYLKVAITRFPPKWWKGPVLNDLSPSIDLLNRSKSGDISEEYYIKQYVDELNRLRIKEGYPSMKDMMKDLSEITDTHPAVVFLCFEKKGDFCHRHILSELLTTNGFKCTEL